MAFAAKPTDPMIAKMATLGKMTRRSLSKTPVEVHVNQRVELPSFWVEQPHVGTVTDVTPTEFAVTWHENRKSGQPRARYRYSRFSPGVIRFL